MQEVQYENFKLILYQYLSQEIYAFSWELNFAVPYKTRFCVDQISSKNEE